MSAESRLLHKLGTIEKDIADMKKGINMITEYIEDSKLTAKERKTVESGLKRIKKGDTSGFVSHEKLRKELGL